MSHLYIINSLSCILKWFDEEKWVFRLQQSSNLRSLTAFIRGVNHQKTQTTCHRVPLC